MDRPAEFGWRSDALRQGKWEQTVLTTNTGAGIPSSISRCRFIATISAIGDNGSEAGPRERRLHIQSIPCSLDNPEFLRVYDPEIIRHLIAQVAPVCRDLLAQECQH